MIAVAIFLATINRLRRGWTGTGAGAGTGTVTETGTGTGTGTGTETGIKERVKTLFRSKSLRSSDQIEIETTFEPTGNHNVRWSEWSTQF